MIKLELYINVYNYKNDFSIKNGHFYCRKTYRNYQNQTLLNLEKRNISHNIDEI